jgi:cephalosporin hydroxylase
MSYKTKSYEEAGRDQRYKETEFAVLLKEFVYYIEPETYLEIGLRSGYIFNQMSPLVKRAVGCDIKLRPEVIKRPNVELYEMSSVDLAKIWKGSIDLLFIDADHRKECVLRDFDLFRPFVTDYIGVIALHDTYPRYVELTSEKFCNTAWEAAVEIKTNPKYNEYELFTIPGPYAGLSLIRKAPKHLHWR